MPMILHDVRPTQTVVHTALTQKHYSFCIPFCPATAAVSPCYVFKPLVTTPMYSQIMSEAEVSSTFADYLPGENLNVLYLNDSETYEDSLYVSQRYLDNGGFATVSICKYTLPYGDFIPPTGSRMCGKVVDWWKSPCQKDCEHTLAWMTRDIGRSRVYALREKRYDGQNVHNCSGR